MIPENFWSHDYATGVETLMTALSVSIAENKQFLSMVQERARIEHATASSLAQLSQEPVMHAIPVHSDAFVPKSSSLQSALTVFTTETVNQAVMHTRIASDLDNRVRLPLQKWCDMYARRVSKCGQQLNSLVARYKQLVQAVNKQRVVYYEQCHKYEDISSSGGSPKDPIIKTIRMLREHLTADPLSSPKKITKDKSSSQKNDDSNPRKLEYRLAGLAYKPQDLADLLRVILQDVTLGEYRVPLLGSYQNVTSGSMLGTATRKHLRNDSFAYAEKFGQSLVDHGFLKPVGQISNKFQSTHTSHYQFQPLAFELVAQESSDESDSDSVASSGNNSSEGGAESIASSSHSAAANPGPSSTNGGSGIIGATDVSEEHYLQAVLELDVYRCEMEQEIMQIYTFLDRLERDREEAIKRGMEDFIRVSFRPEEQHQMQIRLGGAQSRIDPAADLQALVLKNQTGPFIPTVTVFQGYANGNYVQTFGVDLPHSRFFVDIVLDWLPTLPDKDTKCVRIWTHPEPIAEIYKLRAQINTGRPFAPDTIFRFFPLSVVISTLRQYLLELPESVVSFMVYERIKQLYTPMVSKSPKGSPLLASSVTSQSSVSLSHTDASTPIKSREPSPIKESPPGPKPAVRSAQSNQDLPSKEAVTKSDTVSPEDIATVLIQVPLVNRIVLKQIVMYLRDRFSPSEYSSLATALALPLIRPRAPSAINMNDTHPQKLLYDLLNLGPEVFSSLDVKQKEMDASKEMKLARSVFPASPTPSSSGQSQHRVATPVGRSTNHPFANSGIPPVETTSGNNSMRPLSMAHDFRYSSLGSHKAGGHIKSSGSDVSPVRGLGINPIIPLPLAADANTSAVSGNVTTSLPSTSSGHLGPDHRGSVSSGQASHGLNITPTFSPRRPVTARMSSSESSADLQLPKLRLGKN